MYKESKKVRALDPHLWDPEVGHGEAADGKYPQSGEVSWRVQQESGGPDLRAPPAEDPPVNPGQSFLGQFAGKCLKEAFFGQWLLPISWPKMKLSAKPPPSDRAQGRRQCVSNLAGLCNKCTLVHRFREVNYERFWRLRYLIKRFNI